MLTESDVLAILPTMAVVVVEAQSVYGALVVRDSPLQKRHDCWRHHAAVAKLTVSD